MREILFRGKRIRDGSWVHGGIMKTFHPNFDHESPEAFNLRKENCYCICANGKDYFVEQDSIGQYTGLTDKNGKKIFEGDIVDVLYDTNYAGVAAERIGKFEVVFDKGCFMKRKIDGFGLFHFIASDVHTVIGNIHNNPELLKGEEENA